MINNFAFLRKFSFIKSKFYSIIFIVYLYKAFNTFESFFDIITKFSKRRDRALKTTFIFLIL